MSFTFQQSPASPYQEEHAIEPSTSVLHNGQRCGVIVHDSADDVYDIWIAVQQQATPGRLPWRWLHFTTRPALLSQAKAKADNSYKRITTEFTLHLFP